MADSMPIIKMLDSSEIELLARKLPPEVIENHLGHDNSMLDQLFTILPVKPNIDTTAFSAAFRAIFFTTIHRDVIGEEKYDEALYLLINGLISQIL